MIPVALLACPFRAATGLLCPGCGTTRALRALLGGDVAAAWAFNPLLFAAFAAMILFAIRPTLVTRPATAWLSAAVVLSWGILRNV